MADEIILKTWAAATVAPVDDAVIQEVYTGDGGIISGATVTIKDANTLHITGGYGAICGREFQIFASDIPVVLSSSGNLNGRLYIHMDLSQSTNPIQLLTEVAASLTPCVQDADVNLTNGIFEINLATFTVGTSAISGLADVAPKLVGIESSDLTSIKAVGSTNATGSTITKGTYFYLNGKLCLAKSDIANGATFTLNTNYEVVTAGGLNSLNSALDTINSKLDWIPLQAAPTGSVAQQLPSGWKELLVNICTVNPNNNNRQCFSVNIHNSSCGSANNNYFTTGYYLNSNICACIQLKVAGKTSIQLTTANINGTDVISNMAAGVYYK